ncbi:hypothetical protein Nepgr_005261 [Nepenthes gracilis]|uniref:Uncharacterized protein n=1 Tax=Nepenthes gracilis TaxID=150966 RepID=A0AAD3S399_NEPGR|nr:hypothetical protein Nepgr_005261 [Nepenthes gracilis]
MLTNALSLVSEASLLVRSFLFADLAGSHAGVALSGAIDPVAVGVSSCLLMPEVRKLLANGAVCNCLVVREGLLCSADAGLDVVRVLLLLSYSMLMLSFWCNVMDDSQNAPCPFLCPHVFGVGWAFLNINLNGG